MTTAFPIATFLKTDHISRFIFASIPVLNSSMSKFVGFPVNTKDRQKLPHESRGPQRTNHGNRESELPLISSGQLAGQPIRILGQISCPQQVVHVPIELWSARNALQPSVQYQMFAHGQLVIDCCELRADTQ